jgi:small-conductance mechanosensitive channel
MPELRILLELRDWALDLSQWPQKIMWAAMAVLGGLLAGLIISRVIVSAGRKIALGSTDPNRQSADHVLIDTLAVIIRALVVLASVAFAADIMGFYHIEDARNLALATIKGVSILIAIWALGAWISLRIRRFGDRVAGGTHPGGQTLFIFLASLMRFGALAIGLIAALQQFGFPIASLVAVIGAAGLAIALALQDTLKAVASGVIIAVFRPYRIGDFVRVANEEGTVVDITPFTTVLATVDNREIVVTNDKAWGGVMTNFTSRGRRRLELVFPVSYEDDLDQAIELIRTTAEADPRVENDPPVWVKVAELADWSVDIRLRAWCRTEHYVDLRGDLIKSIKQAFDRSGIVIPYPHQVQVEKLKPVPEET